MLLIAAVAVTAWRAWPVAPMAAEAPADVRPATYRYVPLLGLPLEHAVDEVDGDHSEPLLEAPAGPVQTCLPFLAPILKHPNWQLRITSGFASCDEGVVTGDFTIASSGDATWTDPGGPVRHLALSSEQLALVRRLDRLSCVELQREGDERYFDNQWLSIGLDLGKRDELTGARVPAASVLGRAVTAMLEDLKAQYRRSQREVIRSMDLRLATTARGAVYRVRVTGGYLTVKRGSKLLVDDPLNPELLIDLVDAALERRTADKPSVKGVLLVNGRSVPVTLVRPARGPFEVRSREPFELIHHSIDRARHIEAELRRSGMDAYRDWRP